MALKVGMREARKKDPPKKNIVIKFTKKEIKERDSFKKPPERVCDTEASRVERISEVVYTEMGSDSISCEFDRLTLKSNSTRVAEIDMIIYNQMVRAKQQKVLRELSTNQLLLEHLPKSAACSGNVTTRVSHRATQLPRKSTKIPVSVTMGGMHSRQDSTGGKKITLWRK